MGTLPKCSRRPLPDVVIRKARAKDLIGFGDRLRIEDKNEVFALSGLTPQEILKFGFKTSTECWVVLNKGQTEMIFGLKSETTDGLKCIWFLSSDWIKEVPLTFMKQAKAWLKEILGSDVGYNWADIRNTTHLKWIKLMGGEYLSVEQDFGFEKRPFVLFTLNLSDKEETAGECVAH